jgi:hypothetical protein
MTIIFQHISKTGGGSLRIGLIQNSRKHFGLKGCCYGAKKNVSKKTMLVSPETKKVIKERNQHNAKLYKIANEMLDEAIESYGWRFRFDVVMFKLVNNFIAAGSIIGRILQLPLMRYKFVVYIRTYFPVFSKHLIWVYGCRKTNSHS